MITSQKKELVSHAATILPVKEVEQTAFYYRDKLGFTIEFTWGDPIDYIVLKRGEVSIHLSKNQDANPPGGNHVSIYIFVHDIDAVYQELQQAGADIATPLDTRDYGMRDFDVKDPDGYLISFGQGVDS